MKLFEDRNSVLDACREVRRTKSPALAARMVSASIDKELDVELDELVSDALHCVMCDEERPGAEERLRALSRQSVLTV